MNALVPLLATVARVCAGFVVVCRHRQPCDEFVRSAHLRQQNPGATNVLRSGSKAAAVLTLLWTPEGWLPVALVLGWGQPHGVELRARRRWWDLAAFAGHLWPVFSALWAVRGGDGFGRAGGLFPLAGLWRWCWCGWWCWRCRAMSLWPLWWRQPARRWCICSAQGCGMAETPIALAMAVMAGLLALAP